MKYNKKADIYTCESIPNGYGGFEKEYTLFATVDACITPLHYDTMSVGNVIRVNETCKLFTKIKLPALIDHVIVDGVKYRVQLHNDFGKVQMLNLEKVGNLPNG